MLIVNAPRFKWSDVTPERLYLDRRTFMAGAAALLLAPTDGHAAVAPSQFAPLDARPNPAFRLAETPTKFESAATYNNFYEFGVNKEDPARLAGTLRSRPWKVQVDGLVKKPKTFDVEELLKLEPLE